MLIHHFKLFALVILLMLCAPIVKAQHITLLQQGKPTNIRGLSVVDDSIAWISGSKGHIAITVDGGKNWAWQQIKGYEKSDFRAIQAFSAKEAVIMSSGTPSLVLKTIDGGKTWAEKYRNADTSYFLDAMDFADAKHGYILGDPIKNKFILLGTSNAGETWNIFKTRPNALAGEAAFAASGTCLRVINDNIYIVTGGFQSRILNYNSGNGKWEYWKLPIIQGKPSQGAFSLAIGHSKGIFTGGDYLNDKKTDSVAAVWSEGYFLLIKPIVHGPSGYQSCVEEINRDIFLSTGTPGTNITTDGGQTWSKIDNTSFNVCRKARHGALVLLAENDGKIAIFNP